MFREICFVMSLRDSAATYFEPDMVQYVDGCVGNYNELHEKHKHPETSPRRVNIYIYIHIYIYMYMNKHESQQIVQQALKGRE